MEKTAEIKGWAARDADGEVYFYSGVRPWRNTKHGFWVNHESSKEIPSDWFPSVQWSDPEPREATITITLK